VKMVGRRSWAARQAYVMRSHAQCGIEFIRLAEEMSQK
jgi:hypothetical protein